MLALLGPAFDIYTKGGFVFWRVGGFCSMFAGMMAGFGIIEPPVPRRKDAWRWSAPGRSDDMPPSPCGILLGTLGSAILGIVTAALLVASGLPATGSVASGLALTVEGLVFTGIGAVVAQVFESARSTSLLDPRRTVGRHVRRPDDDRRRRGVRAGMATLAGPDGMGHADPALLGRTVELPCWPSGCRRAGGAGLPVGVRPRPQRRAGASTLGTRRGIPQLVRTIRAGLAPATRRRDQLGARGRRQCPGLRLDRLPDGGVLRRQPRTRRDGREDGRQ